jgi:hypothetical protein
MNNKETADKTPGQGHANYRDNKGELISSQEVQQKAHADGFLGIGGHVISPDGQT